MWINLPITDLFSDVERGSFWWKQWGPRPESTGKAAQTARTALKKVPILIPVYGHCFIPAQPNHTGNPIFFVYRTEISYCGLDVAEFLYRTDLVSSQFNLPTLTANDELHEESRLKNGKDRDHQPTEVPSLTVFPDNSACRSEAESSCNEEGMSSESRELDASAWRLEGADENLETWGRNLDALVRNPQLFSRKSMSSLPRRSEASSERNTDVASRPFGSSNSSLDDSPRKSMDSICFQEQRLSSEVFMRFSKIGSTLAAKIARRIEFWSDIVDRRQRSNMVRKVGLLRSLSSDQHGSTTLAVAENEDNVHAEFRTSFSPKWLAVILEDVSARLRQGGWKEEDISEIVDVLSPPNSSYQTLSLNTQSPSENLALQLDFFSSSLRKAGWSIQDVAEALSFDLVPSDHTIRACTNLSPELPARIVPLAQFVANS
ncbi:hypothetical protein O6H91_04G117700 [Diphasiastrum complanatum]|uniref:Uncharacterized protein n=1 Tax=Diphasiastrum complanatum TaxID=34168 RepID=A0ACC2E0Q8_DIPCM|nr:hypothetical protein O6H91_04G117700 [Diphasiastrum complanatum]